MPRMTKAERLESDLREAAEAADLGAVAELIPAWSASRKPPGQDAGQPMPMALARAAEAGSFECAQALLATGKFPPQSRFEAIVGACEFERAGGDAAQASRIAALLADEEACAELGHGGRLNALDMAAWHGAPGCLRVLAGRVEQRTKGEGGPTPLVRAAAIGSRECVEILLASKAGGAMPPSNLEDAEKMALFARHREVADLIAAARASQAEALALGRCAGPAKGPARRRRAI